VTLNDQKNKDLKVALVGCGRISARHSQLLAEGKIAGAALLCVCDIVPEKAQKIADPYDVPAYSDMHEMMRLEKPDLVAVLTESGHHASHVIQLAQYGAHILVEKPMALTLADADKMIEVCDSAGIKLFVVKQNRFNLPVIKLREALEQQRFGKLTMGTVRVRWCRPQSYYDQDPWRGTWAYDGGVLTNQASHHVDLLEWMMGDVDSVFAMSRTALADIETEDMLGGCTLLVSDTPAMRSTVGNYPAVFVERNSGSIAHALRQIVQSRSGPAECEAASHARERFSPDRFDSCIRRALTAGE
jgi:predicted dehydrogenase